MMKLTIEESLCVMEAGWSTDEEKELLDLACKVIRTEARRLHAQHAIEKRQQEIQEAMNTMAELSEQDHDRA